MQIQSLIRPVFLSSVILTVVGCSSSNDGPIVPSNGGQTATGNGGAATVGGNGTTQPNNGGNTTSNGTGGATNTTSTGGSNSLGGSNATTGGAATGGSTSAGGSSAGGSTSTGGKATGGATSAGGSSAGGSTATGGKATGGATSAGGSTAGGSTATGGKATGGATTTSTGGATTTSTGGATTTATGGSTGTGVSQSSSCPNITWPSAVGSAKSLGGGIKVAAGEVYDGGMAIHNGTLNDCSTGDQDSTDPIIEVASGGTVKNVIMGNKVGDGIHCLGSCTIENVWFPNVCDDAISALGSGTVSIKNSGFKNARDKTIQHNGSATVNIDTVYVETAGKLYRSCGEGCDGGARTATLSNIVAIGVDQVAGASTADSVTLKNICTYRTAAICTLYEPGSDTKATSGVNGTNDGPGSACKFTGADTHALLSKVTGVNFSTDAVCGGPNGYKGGSTATACVSGYDKCLKMCMPGGYGFKELACTSGTYAETTGCSMPTDSTAATNLAGTRVSGASGTVDKNTNCPTEWAISIDKANAANYCVCVKKPGYYKFDNWLAWDCQTKWW